MPLDMSFHFRFLFALLVATALFAVSAAHSQALSLKPFKDDLFAYPGDAVVRRQRRLYGRRLSRDARHQRARRGAGKARARAIYRYRRAQGAAGPDAEDRCRRCQACRGRQDAKALRIIVLYLHGQGGSRKQGVDDFTFGGNFNRIKNLMADNGGLYLSPDFPDFGDKGAAQVAALIDHYAEQSPGAKIFVACGSMGGALCWKLAARNDTRPAHQRAAAARLAVGRELSRQSRLQAPMCRSSSARAAMTWSFPVDEPGSLLPLHPGQVEASLSDPLRALRDRHARHADPHDRLARHAELDAVEGAVIDAPERSSGRGVVVEDRLRVFLAVIGRVDVVLDQREIAVAEQIGARSTRHRRRHAIC